MARIDTKNISDSLKQVLDNEAKKRGISLNELTTEIFEEYASMKLSFESEKRFTDSLNHFAIAVNKNTETIEKYIESNKKMIDILTE